MTEFAEIKKHYAVNPLTKETYLERLEWIGSCYAPATVVKKLYEDHPELFPWSLEVLEEVDWYRQLVVVRTDVPVPSYAYHRFERDAIALSNWVKQIGARLVLPAQVWGFANVPNHEYPYWGHLFKNKKTGLKNPDYP